MRFSEISRFENFSRYTRQESILRDEEGRREDFLLFGKEYHVTVSRKSVFRSHVILEQSDGVSGFPVGNK